jgi:hypothetical protein
VVFTQDIWHAEQISTRECQTAIDSVEEGRSDVALDGRKANKEDALVLGEEAACSEGDSHGISIQLRKC